MPLFCIESEVTFAYRYLVEADTEAQALEQRGDPQQRCEGETILDVYAVTDAEVREYDLDSEEAWAEQSE